jgi:hypothetical protein
MRCKFIIEQLLGSNPECKLLNGFDDAIIGYTQNKSPFVAVYDTEKFISIMIENGQNPKEAVEEFENILRKNFGKNDPIFISL